MKTKKILSLMLTCAMLCSLVLCMGVTAGAEETTVTDTFTFTESEFGNTYNGNYGTLVIKVEDGVFLGYCYPCPIKAKEGYLISKVEITVSSFENRMESINASSGSKSISGKVITFSEVNAASINFEGSEDFIETNQIVVTYVKDTKSESKTVSFSLSDAAKDAYFYFIFDEGTCRKSESTVSQIINTDLFTIGTKVQATITLQGFPSNLTLQRVEVGVPTN